MVYTFLNDNPDMYSPYFVQYLATVIASNIAFNLTGKVALVEKTTQMVLPALHMAAAMDAAEQQERAAREAEHIRGR